MSDSEEVLTRTAEAPDLSLQYGDGPYHVLDVRLPAAASGAALVVVVHGGFWRSRYDRSHTYPQCDGLVAAGYVAATVEYRRVGGRGGGWPGTFDDIASVTDSVVSLVADAVGRRVDQQRVVLVGHSAGAHLARWAASRHRLPPDSPWRRAEPLPVHGVVSLAGVVDLTMADHRQLGSGAAAALLGGSATEQPERYAAADPARLLPTGIRTVLVHGESDDVVPVEISASYAEQARAAGDQADLHVLEGVGHFELIDPLSQAWPAVLDAIGTALS